ncbi:MAG: hypothetical protein L3J71_01075 [Victivallaceae bacterium]|nr:hypothetical protein [Victivallaceae bacterium]
MKPISRRDFLLSSPRYLIAGAIGGGAFWLLQRGKGNPHTCSSSNGYCKQCPSKKSCGLPAAISFRRVTGRRSDNE